MAKPLDVLDQRTRRGKTTTYYRARSGDVVSNTKFRGYDFCINPYVGCRMGCNYCYVRFFIKDKVHDWGEFVRVRTHMNRRLPIEMSKLKGKRVVIGTMTDPYQPKERQFRITRTILETIANSKNKPDKVGIFTRSPIVCDDLDLIASLPHPRIHFTIPPIPRKMQLQIESVPVKASRRWATVKKIKEAGIFTNVNIAPAIPIVSPKFTDEFARKLAEIQVHGFFVDPMQAYTESMTSMRELTSVDPSTRFIWTLIETIMTDKDTYNNWKDDYGKEWINAWAKYRHMSPDTLPMWSDHIRDIWVNMNTGKQLMVSGY